MYYADAEGNDWGVFNTDDVGKFKSGHCFALYSTGEEAEEKAKKLNEAKINKNKRIYTYKCLDCGNKEYLGMKEREDACCVKCGADNYQELNSNGTVRKIKE